MAGFSRLNFRTQSKLLKSPNGDISNRIDNAQVKATVEAVIADIRLRGDKAVREYSEKFDNHGADSYLLSKAEIETAIARLPKQVIDDITFVQSQVRGFAQHQLASLKDFEVETHPGVFLGQKNVPIESTGAYIPGGKYPLLASAHMTIVTAKVAGVKRVVACTPSKAKCLMQQLQRCTSQARTKFMYLVEFKRLQRWQSAPKLSLQLQ
jgi:sulfopropanediol 3-dehydrogenase